MKYHAYLNIKTIPCTMCVLLIRFCTYLFVLMFTQCVLRTEMFAIPVSISSHFASFVPNPAPGRDCLECLARSKTRISVLSEPRPHLQEQHQSSPPPLHGWSTFVLCKGSYYMIKCSKQGDAKSDPNADVYIFLQFHIAPNLAS